jgi:hypothetical protein
MGCVIKISNASREVMLGALSVPLNVEYAPIQAVTLRWDRGKLEPLAPAS